MDIKVLRRQYDAYLNQTHVAVETSEFTEWFFVSGKLNSDAALEVLRPVIEENVREFCGE